MGLIERNYFGSAPDIPTIPRSIVYNTYSKRYIEKITTCLFLNEPCLLIGDTGCGKTTLVQHLSEVFYKKLYVYNMNQVAHLFRDPMPLIWSAASSQFKSNCWFINYWKNMWNCLPWSPKWTKTRSFWTPYVPFTTKKTTLCC